MFWRCVAVTLGLAVAVSASAVDYPGPFTGDNVVYTDVDESSLTDPLATLYNSPTTDGDDLVFSPTTEFGAFAPNGAALGDVTDGRLVFNVTANEGLFLDTITVNEGGQFATVGTGIVSAVGTIRVRDVDTGSLLLPAVDFLMTNVPATGDSGGAWTGIGSIDLASLNLSSVEVIIENTLLASVGAENGVGFIDKKDFEVSTTTVIPEPASLALMGLGILTMISRRGRDQD